MNFTGKRPDDPMGMHPRYQWSFKNQLIYNDGWYDKNYESIITKYDKLYLK